jgi:outer membrane protein TolC
MASPLLARTQSSNPIAILLAPIVAPFTGKASQTRAETTARVANLLTSRERQAEAEIRAAVATLHGHRAAVAARTLDVQHVEAKIKELETRQKAGLNVTADLTTAKLDLLKAKGALLTAATDWHSAEAKLRQVMGLLVREQ